MPEIKLLNQDCMELLRETPDKFYELAIVAPYGIGEDGLKNHSRGKLANPTMYAPKTWDKVMPPKEYFDELRRVSVNQIIWGGNYFGDFLGKTPCWVVWDKENGENDFADCELAWTSFMTAVRRFKYRWAGMLQGDMKNKEERVHPTQKPVKLYKWLLSKYAKPGDKILDTHAGSMSSVIACAEMGYDVTACEIDNDYFNAGTQRVIASLSQHNLFRKQPEIIINGVRNNSLAS